MLNGLPWILVIVLYFPVFQQLYSTRWDAIDYTHAYFILPLSLLIVWLKRREIQTACLKAHSARLTACFGFLLLFLALALFILGWRWEYAFISTFSLIPLLFGMGLFLYNKELAGILAFPILYLLLLVPIPVGILDSITLPMRYGASVASAALLKALGYDIAREGLLINMGGHEIFMGAPCSGFRSLITMISLGLIYIYFCKGKLFKNLLLFISIIPLALIGNLVRVIALCLVTFYFGEAAGQGFFHDFSGMVVFVIIISGLMGLEKLLGKKSEL